MNTYRISLAAFAAITLGGCAQLAESNPPAYAPDYHDRFPITLANAPETLNVYPMQYASLDRDQKLTVADFARSFRRSSKSILSVAVPADAARSSRVCCLPVGWTGAPTADTVARSRNAGTPLMAFAAIQTAISTTRIQSHGRRSPPREISPATARPLL